MATYAPIVLTLKVSSFFPTPCTYMFYESHTKQRLFLLWRYNVVHNAGAEFFNNVQIHFVLKRLCHGSGGQSPAFHCGNPGSIPGPVHVIFVVGKMTMGQVFLPVLQSAPVSINPLMLNIHLHLHIPLIERRNGRSLGTFQKQCPFGHWRVMDKKVFSLSFRLKKVKPSLTCLV